MQQARQATFRQYVLAGNRLVAREKIAVDDSVVVDNPGVADQRQMYRAPACAVKRGGISVRWALGFVALSILAAGWMVARKGNLTSELMAEYSSYQSRAQAAEAERQALLRQFEELSDESDVTYYAVKRLGMHLATQGETYGVQAARSPSMAQGMAVSGSAGGYHH